MIRTPKPKPPGFRLSFQKSQTTRTPAGTLRSQSGSFACLAACSLVGLLIGGAPRQTLSVAALCADRDEKRRRQVGRWSALLRCCSQRRSSDDGWSKTGLLRNWHGGPAQSVECSDLCLAQRSPGQPGALYVASHLSCKASFAASSSTALRGNGSSSLTVRPSFIAKAEMASHSPSVMLR